MALKRINKELNEFSKSQAAYPDISLYPINDDYFKLQACILGPKGTPYEGGTFFVHINLPSDYPFKPPKISFKTKIYHPNINNEFICCCFIPITDQWSPALTILKLLIMIRDLMANPYTKEVCGDQSIYDEYNKNYEEFVRKATEWTNLYAILY